MRVVTRVKGIQSIKKRLADGTVKVLHYHRATRTRLPDDPSSPEFIAAWRAAEESMKPKRAGTVSLLIDKFKDSADWRALRESTRHVMTINLRAVERKFGTMPIAALEDRRCRSIILGWHEALAKDHPRAADAKVQALQRVLSWAYDRALAPVNPIDSFKHAYSSDRADKIWLPEHIAAMEAVCTPELRLAISLALHTGQRQGDLLRLTWTAFDGDAITMIQSKTRVRVFIPCAEPLRQALAAIKERKGVTILTAPNGRPWTSDAFQKAWKAAYKEAYKACNPAPDLHFHDLRGTAVTRLAEAGCTIPQIAAITGHKPASAQRILEAYMAMTPDLARAGIAKLDEHARNKRL